MTNVPDVPHFDEDDLMERLMGNRELAKRVARTFMDSMPLQLAALAGAIQSSDAQATRHAAHSIKGAAANVSGKAVQDVAAQLEKLGEAGKLEAASGLLRQLSDSLQTLEPKIRNFVSGIK